MTQAQALLAVLASGVRRKRRYWVTDALISSIYPIGIQPEKDIGAEIGMETESMFPHAEVVIGAMSVTLIKRESKIYLDFTDRLTATIDVALSKESALVNVEQDKCVVSAEIGVTINKQVVLVPYTEDTEIVSAAMSVSISKG
ncbi:hypothetical protein [Shewanella algae]|uniref:hypothetical protein n=1 Tax=Shewanella algae TaxID=38313 RepID=UPI0034D5A778